MLPRLRGLTRMPPHHTRYSWLAGFLAAVVLASVPAWCAEPRPKANPAKAAPAKVTANERPEQEAALLAFIRQHHSELAELLGHLQTANPKEYQRAIHDLSLAHQRLDQIRQRDQERYQLELNAWVLHSRIELLVAKLAMNDTPELRAELDRLLNERLDARLQAVQWDRAKAAERVQKLDEQIADLRDRRAEVIERQRAQLTKNYQKLRPAAKRARAGERGEKKSKPNANK